MLWEVWKRERAMDQYAFPDAHESGENRTSMKRALVQGSLYVCCFFFTYIWNSGEVVHTIMQAFLGDESSVISPYPVVLLQTDFMSLQGAWNFIAFAFLSVRDLRQQDETLTLIGGFKIIILQTHDQILPLTTASNRTARRGSTAGTVTSRRRGSIAGMFFYSQESTSSRRRESEQGLLEEPAPTSAPNANK